jgi:GTP-binding protein Era
LLDFKVAIVSAKPQTTRDRILGIYSDERCQAVFVDTPGVMDPLDRFNECLRDSALEALREADAVCHLVDASKPRHLPAAAAQAVRQARKPLFLLINKTDCLPQAEALIGQTDAQERRRAWEAMAPEGWPSNLYTDVLFLSALEKNGLPALVEAVRVVLPEGPPLFDPETLTDRPMRFLAAEIVRQKVLEHCHQEVPYAVATRTEEFIERQNGKFLVRVCIYVEHDSQKAIVIGHNGAMLRAIGQEARVEIEEMADHAIFLELWVKVLKNWRKNEYALQEFGYKIPATKNKRRRRR